MPTADAYRQGLLLLQQQQRGRLVSLIEQLERNLYTDWLRGPAAARDIYTPILDQYARDLAALRASVDDPAATLSLDWLTQRNPQLARIEQNVRASLTQYGQQSASAIAQAQAGIVNQGASDAAQLTQRALWPAVEGAGVPPGMLFNRPNPDAIAQWVGRASNGHPLGDLFANFGAEATTEARKAMLLGLATGANPKAMAQGIANALGISRSRATIIARTEVLGSYRAAAHETYRANADVLDGWIWSAGGANPCAMCMGMDGLHFSLSEELIDHPCGKCAPLPITKPWDDILGPLGIDSSDMLETSIGADGAYISGEEKFARMSPEQQQRIIGTKTGYEAYRRGEVTLKDFIGRRPAEDGFPASFYQKSLREMQIPTRQAQRLVEPSPAIAGPHRASARGRVTPEDQMPAWAKQSQESRIVYQILRNGLPYDMASHEQGLLITNLEQMLKGELPVNVRAAVERQLQALGQTVERTTIGKATQATMATAEETAARDVAVTIRDKDELALASRSFFGRELSHDELAQLLGAPEGAQVVADAESAVNSGMDRIDLLLHGPSWNPEQPLFKSEYDAYRVLLRDKQGNLYIHNINIDVASGAQGQGFGAKLLYDEAQGANKLGISYIETDGAGAFGTDHVGYYAMPRFGFTGELDQEYIDKIGAAVARGDLSQEFAGYTRIEQLMSTPQGREWWRVNGGDLVGLKFDVTPGSYSMRTLEEYLSERGLLGQTVERQTVGRAARETAQGVAQGLETEATRTAETARKVLDESVSTRIGLSDIQPTAEFTRIVRDNQQGDLEWFADMHGMTVAEYEAAVSAKIAETVDSGVISIREPESVLEKILQDGRIKTVHESDSSLTINQGLKTKAELRAEVKMYQEIRAKYEQEAFGYPLDLPAELRPVSGYIAPLEGDDPMARGWGAARVVLKDDARARSTFTVGDSLQNMNSIPEPVNAPKYDAYPFQDGPAKGIERDWWASINDPLTESRFGALPMTYYEAQIHGGVTTDDIAEIIFDAGHTPSPELESALSRLGIPWRMAKAAP